MKTAPQKPGHAPGWEARKRVAGRIERPWGIHLPPSVGGLCESGWHTDCPQAPLVLLTPGTCSCPCHVRPS